MAGNWSRRGFVETLITGAASLLNSRKSFAAGVSNAPAAATVTGFGQSGNPYQELGIPTVINAMGTMTMLGGSLIRPEVELVMSQAAKHFVGIPALEVAAGKRLAEMLKLPQGYSVLVTSGAAAAIQGIRDIHGGRRRAQPGSE